MTPEVDVDLKPLATAAQRRCRVLQAEITRLVTSFQHETGLCVEAIEVQQTDVSRYGKRELLPRVQIKVAL